MNNPLVSLIVPCYNVASVCDKFFESILLQTYHIIEIVLVNDGSTDNTEEKLMYYKEKLEKSGFQVKYIYQENKGLGGAINTGLKIFTGDFLCWADPDDYFENNSFELRVQYMQEHPECAVVTSDAYIRNGDLVSLVSSGIPKCNEWNQFELLIKKESIFCSGCHMVRTSAFEEVNPQRDIYEYRRGQNWQLLLPLYYSFERHFLNIPLYNYLVYESSMSHIKENYIEKQQKNSEHLNTIIQTIKRMNISKTEKTIIINGAEKIYCRFAMDIAYSYGKTKDYYNSFKQLINTDQLNYKYYIKLFIILFKKGLSNE